MRRKKLSVNIVVPFLVVAMFFSIMIYRKYIESRREVAGPTQQQVEGTKSIALMFVKDGISLQREMRNIEYCDNDTRCIEAILEELFNGPVGELDSSIPDGTALQSASVSDNIATISLNNIFADGQVGGSHNEMLAVYSIVNSICVNLPSVKGVKININGIATATLGHLDLAEVIQSDTSLEVDHGDELLNKSK